MNERNDPGLIHQCLILLGLAAVIVGLVACGQRGIPPLSKDSPITVRMQTIQTQVVQDRLILDGTVAPVQQVQLVARVPGTLDAIDFNDGQMVKRGQQLFTIEQDTYQAELQLSQAALAQAHSEYNRQVQMLKQNATAKASVDTALSNMQQAQANVRLAQINLGYTEIHAPFEGMMSKRAVDAGNYVGATQGGTVLATITQLSPIYVNAAVGEREALQLRQKVIASGRKVESGIDQAVVKAQLQDDKAPTETGVLDFIDHQVGQTSGTIAVRGLFTNADRHLLPGLYAKLIIDLGAHHEALVLANDMLQNDQQGDYIFVVNNKNVAQRRNIETRALPGQESSEVTAGLNAGERVVISGQTKLRDGQAVVEERRSAAGSAP